MNIPKQCLATTCSFLQKVEGGACTSRAVQYCGAQSCAAAVVVLVVNLQRNNASGRVCRSSTGSVLEQDGGFKANLTLFFFFKTAFPHYCDCEAHRGGTRSGSSGPGCPASSTRPLHPACSQSLPATFSGCSLNKAFCSVRPGLTQCGSLCRPRACGEVRPPLTDTQVWPLPPMRSAAKSERSDESA